MKKFLSILLALVMCFAVAVPAFAVNTTGDLKFGTDGKFSNQASRNKNRRPDGRAAKQGIQSISAVQ